MVNAAYLMKLGWGVLTNKDALWVRVLRCEYGCGNLTVPIMKLAHEPRTYGGAFVNIDRRWNKMFFGL